MRAFHASRAKREELRQCLNLIPGIDISEDRLGGRPAFKLEVLSSAQSLEAFLLAFTRVVQETRVFWATGDEAAVVATT